MPTPPKPTRKLEQRPAMTAVDIDENDLPPEVYDKFLKEGFSLRRIRLYINNEEDYRNIGKKMRQGYQFITADELPKEFIQFFRVRDTSTHKNLVTIGDSAFAKIPVEYAEALREKPVRRSLEQLQAVNIALVRSAPGLNKSMPIYDESSSTTTIGGRKSAGFGSTLKSEKSNEDQTERIIHQEE